MLVGRIIPARAGTHRVKPPIDAVQRIIPARAGNASVRTPPLPLSSDHPRAGGERGSRGVRPRARSGSSPRGRGTLTAEAKLRNLQRIIPARAGNACRPTRVARSRPDHPRAGRGTHRRTLRAPGTQRIIPARAGNATQPIRPMEAVPDHPRAGGERPTPIPFEPVHAGSSPRGRGTQLRLDALDRQSRIIPRGRGTPLHPTPAGIGTRIIPARAGNAAGFHVTAQPSADHPRAGGERPACRLKLGSCTGSSPRGRGTHVHTPEGEFRFRIIPARAGNAANEIPGSVRQPDHPRAGGERAPAPRRPPPCRGSSPRGRGTLSHAPIVGVVPRIIPRAGGERGCGNPVDGGAAGSSPRGRGTQPRRLRPRRRRRIIPARAGNALGRAPTNCWMPDHPRAGGEREPENITAADIDGSSPRGRGTPVVAGLIGILLRIIPARAGNALGASVSRQGPADHPRAGGERASAVQATGLSFGSSPRGRGTRLGNVAKQAPDRIIPARAGNAIGFRTSLSPITDHPRAGGERTGTIEILGRLAGSSPRGRGTPACT